MAAGLNKLMSGSGKFLNMQYTGYFLKWEIWKSFKNSENIKLVNDRVIISWWMVGIFFNMHLNGKVLNKKGRSENHLKEGFVKFQNMQ